MHCAAFHGSTGYIVSYGEPFEFCVAFAVEVSDALFVVDSFLVDDVVLVWLAHRVSDAVLVRVRLPHCVEHADELRISRALSVADVVRLCVALPLIDTLRIDDVELVGCDVGDALGDWLAVVDAQRVDDAEQFGVRVPDAFSVSVGVWQSLCIGVDDNDSHDELQCVAVGEPVWGCGCARRGNGLRPLLYVDDHLVELDAVTRRKRIPRRIRQHKRVAEHVVDGVEISCDESERGRISLGGQLALWKCFCDRIGAHEWVPERDEHRQSFSIVVTVSLGDPLRVALFVCVEERADGVGRCFTVAQFIELKVGDGIAECVVVRVAERFGHCQCGRLAVSLIQLELHPCPERQH